MAKEDLAKATYAYSVACENNANWDWDEVVYFSKIVVDDWNKLDDKDGEFDLTSYAIMRWKDVFDNKKTKIRSSEYTVSEVSIESGCIKELKGEMDRYKENGYTFSAISTGYGKYGFESDKTYLTNGEKRVYSLKNSLEIPLINSHSE